jgi:cold shock CspA family protein
MQGVVSFFKGGWGFAHVPDIAAQGDVFLHHSEILGNRRFLTAGEEIVFDLSERKGKPYAKNIRKVKSADALLSELAPGRAPQSAEKAAGRE